MAEPATNADAPDAASLLEWGDPYLMNTRRGDRVVRTAKPTPAFDALVREQSGLLKKAGMMRGRSGDILWFRTPTPELLADIDKVAQRQEKEREGLVREAVATLALSAPKTISTSNGLRDLQTAPPTPEFKALWQRHRRELSNAGFSLKPHYKTGEMEVAWWQTPKLDKADIEASRRAEAQQDGPALIKPDGLEYLPFQSAGIEYCLKRPSAIIGDEMGLGKTIQALGVANNDPSLKRLLIVCPASLRLNWAAEMRKWLVQERPILMPTKNNPEIPDGPAAVVVSYEGLTRLRRRDDFPMQWDLCVFDEAHYIKNPKAQRTQAALGIDGRRTLMLTGTPIPNRPVELWPILHKVDPKQWSSWTNFVKSYCGGHKVRVSYGRHEKIVWKVDGSTRQNELQERLRASVMVRRTKADVLPELPAKRRSVIKLELDPDGAGEAQAACRDIEILGDKLEAFIEQLEGSEPMSAPFHEMSEIRERLGRAKAPHIAEQVVEALTAGGISKMVVFAHHHSVMETLRKTFDEAGLKSVILTGKTPEKERDAAVQAFQNDPDVQVFIGSIKAAGVGLTLTAAADVTFAELPWVPADVSQAEDRCHRIGQASSVNVRHYVVQESIDERLVNAIVVKQHLADLSLDIQSDDPRQTGRGAFESKKPEWADKPPPVLASEADSDLVRQGLLHIQSMCDGVHVKDGMGFSLTTSGLGRALAARSGRYTERQLAAGLRVCTIHKGQLPESITDALKDMERGLKAQAEAAEAAADGEDETPSP